MKISVEYTAVTPTHLRKLPLIAIAAGFVFHPSDIFAARPIVSGPTISPMTPDVCDTPSTPHGVPVPFPSTANSSNVNKVKRTVKIADSDDNCNSGDDDSSDDDSNDSSDDSTDDNSGD